MTWRGGVPFQSCASPVRLRGEGSEYHTGGAKELLPDHVAQGRAVPDEAIVGFNLAVGAHFLFSVEIGGIGMRNAVGLELILPTRPRNWCSWDNPKAGSPFDSTSRYRSAHSHHLNHRGGHQDFLPLRRRQLCP